MTVYHNYLAVIGRVTDDTNDSLELYQHMTIVGAEEAFRADVRSDFSGDPDPTDQREVLITAVLTSTAPITVEYNP